MKASLKPNITVEMCETTLRVAMEGGDFSAIARELGLVRQTVSSWYKRGSFSDDDECFSNHPRYQMFSASVDIGQAIYHLNQVQKRIRVNSIHANPLYVKEVGNMMSKASELDDRGMNPNVNFAFNSTNQGQQSSTKADDTKQSLISYHEALMNHHKIFEGTYKHPVFGRPKKGLS